MESLLHHLSNLLLNYIILTRKTWMSLTCCSAQEKSQNSLSKHHPLSLFPDSVRSLLSGLSLLAHLFSLREARIMSTPARKRLMRDFKRLQQDPPAGISGAPQDNNIMLWNAVIFGYPSLVIIYFIGFFALTILFIDLIW